jgi:hypothetical protein
MPAPYPLQLELHTSRRITDPRTSLRLPRAPSAYCYALRVEAYAGFLADRYPPFSLAA